MYKDAGENGGVGAGDLCQGDAGYEGAGDPVSPSTCEVIYVSWSYRFPTLRRRIQAAIDIEDLRTR